MATIFLFRQSMRWAMLVVSDVLTTIVPSGLTATPSGSTPTGNWANTLRVATSIAVKSGVVFVRDEQELPVRAQAQLLRVGAGRQLADLLQGFRVDNRDRIVVAGANEHLRAVLAERDAARPLAGLDGARDLELVDIDDRDRIALLVGDVGGHRPGRRKGAEARQKRERAAAKREGLQ